MIIIDRGRIYSSEDEIWVEAYDDAEHDMWNHPDWRDRRKSPEFIAEARRRADAELEYWTGEGRYGDPDAEYDYMRELEIEREEEEKNG